MDRISMISNPRLLLYSCIAKGTVILAEFVSKEERGIEALALRCIEDVPPHHSMISHTVHKRTYALIIDGLFSYFAILDDVVAKPESLWLFSRLKSATESLITEGSSLDNPTKHCLQSKLDPVFAEIIAGGGGGYNHNKDLELELGLVGSPREIKNNHFSREGRKGGGGGALMPLLGKPLRVLKNKKRLQTEAKSQGGWNEKKMIDLGGGGGGGGKGVRNGLMVHDHYKQKAKQIWRKHVWIVLMFDLCICLVLFGIWLWVCQGLQCIQA